MEFENLLQQDNIYFLEVMGDNPDRIFTEEAFGIALYEKGEGRGYFHQGVCGSIKEAYDWLHNKDISILKIHKESNG